MKGQMNSPMGESTAINPVNLGPLLTAAVNNLWALLAVVFRFCSLPTTTLSTNTTPSCNLKLEEEAAAQVRPQTTSSYNPPSTCISTTPKIKEEEGVLTRGNSSKQLFTVRLHEEEEDGGDDHDQDDDEMDGGDEAIVKRWGRAATTLTVEIRRAGDLGWYGFQDMRVIDGSVVRLWDDVVKQGRGSPPAYPRRCSSFGIPTSC